MLRNAEFISHSQERMQQLKANAGKRQRAATGKLERLHMKRKLSRGHQATVTFANSHGAAARGGVKGMTMSPVRGGVARSPVRGGMARSPVRGGVAKTPGTTAAGDTTLGQSLFSAAHSLPGPSEGGE